MVSLYNLGEIDRREVPVHEGEVVGVIGCGNVGMDAARTALRMGARGGIRHLPQGPRPRCRLYGRNMKMPWPRE